MKVARSTLALGCLVLACKTVDAGGPPKPQELEAPVNYTMGSGDVLQIRVFGEADLSGVYSVSADGTIEFPFCKQTRLTGLTAAQSAEALTKCLGSGYLKNPQVTVVVTQYNSKKVFVLGEVQKPGTFVFEDGMSVVQVITLAGGFSPQAAKNSVRVTRTVAGTAQEIHIAVEDIAFGKSANFLLQPGDIVFVPKSFI